MGGNLVKLHSKVWWHRSRFNDKWHIIRCNCYQEFKQMEFRLINNKDDDDKLTAITFTKVVFPVKQIRKLKPAPMAQTLFYHYLNIVDQLKLIPSLKCKKKFRKELIRKIFRGVLSRPASPSFQNKDLNQSRILLMMANIFFQFWRRPDLKFYSTFFCIFASRKYFQQRLSDTHGGWETSSLTQLSDVGRISETKNFKIIQHFDRLQNKIVLQVKLNSKGP